MVDAVDVLELPPVSVPVKSRNVERPAEVNSPRRFLLPLVALVVVLLASCGPAADTGSVAAGFPPNANHPKPVDKTFLGCPPQGDGGDSQLNILKNRIDDGENGAYHDVALSTLISLTFPQDIGKVRRDNWTSADVSAVAPYEGVAIRTVGYLVDVKHEGTESPNCHDVDHRDFHVWIVPNQSDGKASAMVVEVAPRVRDQRPGWTDTALSNLRGQKVRISGWLMLDQEHPEQLGKTRATLYEIHPILHIEVSQGGGWTSIDS